jgi:hypothetical protein
MISPSVADVDRFSNRNSGLGSLQGSMLKICAGGLGGSEFVRSGCVHYSRDRNTGLSPGVTPEGCDAGDVSLTPRYKRAYEQRPGLGARRPDSRVSLRTGGAVRRERSLYFASLIALVAVACFVLNLSALSRIFNITPSPNAFLAWAASSLLLAYGYGLKLVLVAWL